MRFVTKTVSLIEEYLDRNTFLSIHQFGDGKCKFEFDYAEITTESKEKIRLTYDDLKSLKRILTAKEFNL